MDPLNWQLRMTAPGAHALDTIHTYLQLEYETYYSVATEAHFN